MNDKIKINLGALIFELYNVKSLDEIIFSKNIAEKLKKRKDLDSRKEIHNSLNWAKDNPNFDFESIMENSPVTGKLPFSNSEIYNYLMQFKIFMENNRLLIEE